ncbi:hypothetical protein JD844_014010 [Phrynosoma platyrhinos]|uniref:Ras-associating domain-containing protein n=1 Tax=Phrynosoma platyrhinos TaxID=52577 RepID=A0ABQ7TLZ4_PHRPL|nr:hypothetical protein JD844_014010 [Phrynosoma platyrhinos]
MWGRKGLFLIAISSQVPFELISLNPGQLGAVDAISMEQRQKERLERLGFDPSAKEKFSPRRRLKGRNSAGSRLRRKKKVADEERRDLFLRLVPHECLGSLWSQRDKKGHEGACPTVRATVAQFNLVAKAVVFSCLWDTGLRAAQRARLLEKWIRVAEYLSVFLLQDCLRCYEELSAICSEEDNYSQSRRLLFQEFEILTQLRLLQANCRNYTLNPDPVLRSWFRRLPSLSETQSYQLSCAIEPPGEGGTPAKPMKPTLVITHCTDLLASLSMSSLVPWDRPCSPNPPPDLLLPPLSSTGQGQMRLPQPTKWPSVSALNTASESTAPASPGGLVPPPPQGGTFIKGHRRSASCGAAYPTAPNASSSAGSECRIIRVRMALQDGTLYKSILVTSQDKAPTVIVKALEKHNQDRGLASQYELVQLLPDGRELAFPPTANVFYAMNSSCQDFMLRAKQPQEKALPPTAPPTAAPRSPTPRRVEISATFPKIKATGRKIAKALF